MMFVVISTVGMCLNTMHAFQHTDLRGIQDFVIISRFYISSPGKPLDNPKLALIESVCISWFTLEYLLRFAGSPNKVDFLIDGMNIIDVLAIMPYYVTLFLLKEAPLMPPEPGFVKLLKMKFNILTPTG